MALVLDQEKDDETRHSDDVQDIITAVPSWILRWGITLFFMLLVLLIGLSALIRYPDIVKAPLKIVSPNAPKPVIMNVSGKFIKILVHEKENVKAGQSLAFLEGSADHEVVMKMLACLHLLQKQLEQNQPVANAELFTIDYTRLGELQIGYQLFCQEYLLYRSSVEKGGGNEKRVLLQRKRVDIEMQMSQLQKKAKFSQELNRLIIQAEEWKNKYILTASQAGKIRFAGIIQTNQMLAVNQEVFYINSGDEQFFGEMAISQNSMGKIKEGQEVLVKLKSYPFEEYGMLRGKISYLSDIPKDSMFTSVVNFKVTNLSDQNKPIQLKHGMMADAEIITQDATIFQRLSWNVLKATGYK